MGAARITAIELLAFAAGELDGPSAERIRSHLETNEAARATVERYRAARKAMSGATEAAPRAVVDRARRIFRPARKTSPSWLERLDRVLAALIYDSRQQPALAGFRGGSERFQAAWSTDSAEVDVEALLVDIAATPGGTRRWQITGQIASEDSVSDVTLVRAGSRDPVASTKADETGMFMLEAVADRYDLLVHLGDRALVIEGLKLQ